MSTGMTQFDARPPGRRRGWARLWQTPVFVLGLLCVVIVGATASLRDNPGRDFQRELKHLRQALRGERELPDRSAVIEPLLARAESMPRQQAECEFLVGSYFYRRGELDAAAPESFARANTHLTRALSLNVADNDLPMLFFRLGMTHYRQGQHLVQALNWIRQGLDLGAENPVRGYAFLVEAYLKLPQPNLAAALSANQRHLEFVDDRDPEVIGQARCQHADILRRLERRDDALHELEQIDGKIDAPLLAKVRLLQALCSEDEGQWMNALEFWKALEPIADHVDGGKGRVCYALGHAHTRLEPVDDAAVESHWRQAIAAGGDEGQAAGIRLGHRLLFGGRYDPEQAVKEWTAAFDSIRVSGDYKNPYLELAHVVELFEQGCDHFLERRDFPRSQTLANLLARIAPPGAAEEKIGQTHFRWAKNLVAQAERNPKESESLLREARARYQDAGDYFKQASLSRATNDKIELFWQSATCYLAARDYADATAALETFVALTQANDRRSQGHFALADAYHAQGQKAKAREHYLKCIELNAPPYVYRALAKLAKVEIDARKLDNAREILVQILNRNGPDLERDIHELALFSLGNVLFDLGEGDEGAVRLGEAIRRFPNNPTVWAVRQKLADHAWEHARQISVADLSGVSPERRPLAEAMMQKRRGYLLEAHDAFQAIAGDLKAEHQLKKTLGNEQILIWRNALLNVGGLKFELGEYAEAIIYNRGVQDMYKGRVESLYATRQVFNSWQQLSKTPAARPQLLQLAVDAVQIALRDLDEIPRSLDEEVFLSGPHPFSRDQWQRLLRNWEGTLQHVTLHLNPRAFLPRD